MLMKKRSIVFTFLIFLFLTAVFIFTPCAAKTSNNQNEINSKEEVQAPVSTYTTSGEGIVKRIDYDYAEKTDNPE